MLAYKQGINLSINYPSSHTNHISINHPSSPPHPVLIMYSTSSSYWLLFGPRCNMKEKLTNKLHEFLKFWLIFDGDKWGWWIKEGVWQGYTLYYGGFHGCDRMVVGFTTRYDYNLTIMKSPKPVTDNRLKKN